MIELKNISKKYNGHYAVKDLNVKICEGCISMIIGPSGCGKTTTLRMINRLIEPTEGELCINNKNVNDYNPVLLRRNIGYVIQEIGLFPHFTVEENISVVPKLLKWEKERINRRVEELLELVSLEKKYKKKYPFQLSGGEKQRVGLARALASDPDILLMDEPFGAIDPINRSKLHDSFLEIQKKIKKTIVFVTHDINEAIKLGDNLIILRNGRLIQEGEIKSVLKSPKNDFVKSLLGEDRNLKGLILKKSYKFAHKNDVVIIHDRSDIDHEYSRKNSNSTIVLIKSNKIKGYFDCNDKQQINFHKNVVVVGKYSNLKEVLSKMMEYGEDRAFVKSNDSFQGIIRLTDILEEMRTKY